MDSTSPTSGTATFTNANGAAANATPSAPPASLYVGELHPDVSESMLYELFSRVGSVASIRVCRDAITRRSLGYAYVNYHTYADADRALDSLNYTMIKDKPCRIMWSQRDPSLRRAGTGNIFIKNLDKSIDTKALHDTFNAFGNILSCKVVSDENGSKGFGFVHFETTESADQAIAKVNGMLLNDKKVYVGYHVPRKERESKSDEIKQRFTNVFVKNLDEGVTDEELSAMFAQFGVTTSVVIQRDEAGQSKGFGFVNYENFHEANAAVEALNDKEINGKKIFVGRAQKKNERETELKKQYEQARMERLNKYQGINLYVKNLDDAIDDEKIRQEFSPYGTITSARVMRDEKGNTKGFGFVCFTTTDEAAKAVTEMNGRMIGSKPIYVALAQRKDVRRQQLEVQYAQRAQMRMQQPGLPMYPGMYYQSNPAAPLPQRPGFMFPQQMMAARPAGRWPNGPAQAGSRNPAYPGAVAGAVRPAVRPSQKQNSRPANASRSNASGAQQKRNVNARTNRPEAPAASNLQNLSSAPPEIQKQMLGNQLYPFVLAREPEHAGKITGMLLEMDNSEILHLLESPEALSSKVNEAVTVLKQHLAETTQTA